MSEEICTNPEAQDALDRMKRAHERGTGCHLTREMIAGLGRTFIAETWSQPRPTPGDPHG